MTLQFSKYPLLVKWLSILFLLLPVLVYILIFIPSLVNFPFYDDFFWYNKLILQANNQPFLTQLELIAQQHSDHRLIFLKGFALVTASLGPFDFRWPILFTNALFLLFAVHLTFSIYRATRQWILAVPCLFILFQFLPYTVVFVYALQTLGVLLFLYFAFFYVWKTDRLAYLITGFSAVLCILTNTNGLILLPVLAVLYSLTHRFRISLIYGLATILAFVTYFSGSYRWNAGAINTVPLYKRLVPSYLFLTELLGSFFNTSLTIGHLLALIFGSLVLFFTVWTIINQAIQVDWRRWFIKPVSESKDVKRHLILTATCMVGFILFTCLVLTDKRFGGIDMSNNIAPHYRQYSSFALCFCYVVSLLYVQGKQWEWPYFITCLLLAALVNLSSYLYIHHDLRMYTLSLRADTYNWQANKSILFFPPIEGDKAWKTVSSEMALTYDKKLISAVPPAIQAREVPGVLKATLSHIPDGTTITLTDSSHNVSYLRTAFIVLRNAGNDYYFPFINQLNAPRPMLHTRSLLSQTGATFISPYIPNFVLPAGLYQAFLFDEDQKTIRKINTLVEIPRRESTTNY